MSRNTTLVCVVFGFHHYTSWFATFFRRLTYIPPAQNDNDMNTAIRILLIDDHRHIHQIVEKLLENVNDIVIVGQGNNGREAIQLCEQLQPDLILMDVVMPVIDGVQATKYINEKFPDVKILVLSSFQDHESVHTMLHYGAVGYLTKGELATQLVSTIPHNLSRELRLLTRNR